MGLGPQGNMPAAPILTPPAGWLGLLNMKSSGAQPGPVVNALAPVLDMFPFYEAGGRTTIQGNFGVNAGADGVGVALYAVPAGKVAIIHSVIVKVVKLGAVGAVSPYIRHLTQLGGSAFDATPIPPQPIAALTGFQLAWHGPFLMLPNEVLDFVEFTPAAATAHTFDFSVQGAEVHA